MSAPLTLFWWKGVPNFGDAISPAVVAHLSGRVVEHSGPRKADLIAIGSLLQIVRRKLSEHPREDKPFVWGTGMLGPVNKDVLDHVNLALLRGPVSAALLGVEARAFGDPGLLVNDVYPAPPRRDVVGVVPHHTRADDPQLRAVIDADPALALIDPRGDAEAVCTAIGSCAHVIASSLHGLIVADAYGVPSTWLDPVGQGRLKYHDYAASVGRDLTGPIAVADIPSALRQLPATIRHADGIERCRAALRNTFPAALKAAPHNAAPAAA